MTTPAPQITAALEQAFVLFQDRLKPNVLKEPRPVFNILFQFARQVGAFVGLTGADPAQIMEAVYQQIQEGAHLLDRNSIGLQHQREGRPLQMSDLIIQWTVPPRALTKYFQQHRASWIDEVDAREKEAEQHLQHLEVRKVHEQARASCPGVIANFQPVRRGHVVHSEMQRVQAALQTYFDKYEAQHAADLARYEADKTFTAWSVNWAGPQGVLAKMREFADKEYARIENRTPESERL